MSGVARRKQALHSVTRGPWESGYVRAHRVRPRAGQERVQSLRQVHPRRHPGARRRASLHADRQQGGRPDADGGPALGMGSARPINYPNTGRLARPSGVQRAPAWLPGAHDLHRHPAGPVHVADTVVVVILLVNADEALIEAPTPFLHRLSPAVFRLFMFYFNFFFHFCLKVAAAFASFIGKEAQRACWAEQRLPAAARTIDAFGRFPSNALPRRSRGILQTRIMQVHEAVHEVEQEVVHGSTPAAGLSRQTRAHPASQPAVQLTHAHTGAPRRSARASARASPT